MSGESAIRARLGAYLSSLPRGSASEFAEVAGIHPGIVSRFRNGSSVSKDNLKKIELALNKTGAASAPSASALTKTTSPYSDPLAAIALQLEKTAPILSDPNYPLADRWGLYCDMIDAVDKRLRPIVERYLEQDQGKELGDG